ncbi:helix-turn-helix domain-containing protein [Arsenicicoccus piscis]|uniref:helix-turn-helix domain-containing protein n=1 Tax=Arsenicicoccus piscis TaxID=673954 RepID=UPI001F4C6110|nr:helix-turn-helix domain-containing protein [Arsenicicoccus piscis]MCH8627750.1 helix-turn-helix domain-containing protein [Arsenicicoccus piscis]
MSATRPTPLAGTVLREARLVAGLSQSELARRAGVTQSVISTYESGGRDPSLTTLARLVAATGQRLSVVVEPGPEGAHQGIPDTRLGRRLRRRRAALMAAAQRRGATNLRVFGSVARGEDGPDSDVDLLVDLAPGGGLFALAGLERELAEILGVEVDVSPVDSLKPRVRDRAEREAIAL